MLKGVKNSIYIIDYGMVDNSDVSRTTNDRFRDFFVPVLNDRVRDDGQKKPMELNFDEIQSFYAKYENNIALDVSLFDKDAEGNFKHTDFINYLTDYCRDIFKDTYKSQKNMNTKKKHKKILMDEFTTDIRDMVKGTVMVVDTPIEKGGSHSFQRTVSKNRENKKRTTRKK